MVNHNGNLVEIENASLSVFNRGYKYGDALFETIRVANGKVLFLEDHYFRLMASMRIMRMDIPMNYTMEFFEHEILKTIDANPNLNNSARIRLNVDRGEGGKYMPSGTSKVHFNIVAEPLNNLFYSENTFEDFRVDLFKDYYLSPGLLSGLKTNNKVLQIIGSIYAEENDLDNCLVLNTNKLVVEALNGNLFLVKGEKIKTPPLDDGCLRGVMRKQILGLLEKDPNYIIEESSISPFELQKADELFITNTIVGIQSIGSYRKKNYANKVAKDILTKLNTKIRLS